MKIEDLSSSAVNNVKSVEPIRSSDIFLTSEWCQQPREGAAGGLQLHRNLLRRRHVRKEQKLQEMRAREQHQRQERNEKRREIAKAELYSRDEKPKKAQAHVTSGATVHARPITASSKTRFLSTPCLPQEQTYYTGELSHG